MAASATGLAVLDQRRPGAPTLPSLPAPPEPPKQRKTWLWVGLGAAAVALVCLAIAISDGSSERDGGPSSTATTSAAPPKAAAEPGIGEPARDGKFEFVVKDVKCGVESVGQGLTKTAQGQFCLVTVTVKNIGDEPQTMFDSNQKGFDSNQKGFDSSGAEYGTDSAAGMYANSDNAQVWITEINPGNQVTGMLVFDLPENVDLFRLRMHDSAFSGGVEIKVK